LEWLPCTIFSFRKSRKRKTGRNTKEVKEKRDRKLKGYRGRWEEQGRE
jgi:hypothetical protein